MKLHISTESEFYDWINRKTDNWVYKTWIKDLSLKISEAILARIGNQNKAWVEIIEEYNEKPLMGWALMKKQISLIQQIQNKINLFGWKPYYDNVNYRVLDDGSFELVYDSDFEKVYYKSKTSFDYINSSIGSLIDLNAFGGIPSTEIDFEAIIVESKNSNQLNEFFYNSEKDVFIGRSKKKIGFTFSILIIEQKNKLLFPNISDENFKKFNEDIMKNRKEWYFKEYKKMRIDFYKSHYSS